jgi:uncharacterized protein YecT (DUF1311 family)
MVRLFVFALLLAVSRLFSQPTPEWKAFWEKQAASRKSGADALQRERERQKADPCSTAKSTKDISECLSQEFKTTDANYLAYVRSIGALLRLAPPADGHQSSADTKIARIPLDDAESAWQSYREKACAAMAYLYRGGSIIPVAQGSCLLSITWSHLDELEKLYADLWH